MSELEQIESCAECEATRFPFYTEASSAKLGTYYKGKPICQSCLDRYREAAWNRRHKEGEG